MTPQNPAEVRTKAYAGVELLLDICHAARSLADVDLESLLIYFCVVEATMRPLMVGPDTPAEILTADVVPEQYRGSVSMLLVSDRLGLPRETVRRKIKSLIGKGMLTEDESGRIRSAPNLSDPNVRKAAETTYEAAWRYLARLRQHGVAVPADPLLDAEEG